MKRPARSLIAAMCLVAMFATPVFAHTGPVNGTPGDYTLVDHVFDVDAPTQTYHVEAGGIFKGWYSAAITNKSGQAWAGMKIEAIGTGVYIVQGTGLMDEWDIKGTSVVCTQPTATATYSAGAGNASYGVNGNRGTGTLHKSVYFAFDPLIAANGGKVSFRIYTDNTANENGSFGILFTPTFVPEPGSMLAMFSGLIGFAGLVLRRRQ